MFVETKPEGEATTSKWARSLLKAIDVLNERGWCQKTEVNAKGEHCLLGAVWFAHYGEEPTHGPISEGRRSEWPQVWDIMQKQLGMAAADWNDVDGRTKDEVIAVLRAAAASVL